MKKLEIEKKKEMENIKRKKKEIILRQENLRKFEKIWR